MTTPHVNDNTLEQYAMGVLDGQAIPEIEEHLLICSVCQTRLLQADEFLAVFRAAAAELEPVPVPRWKSVLDFRLIAGAVAAVVVLLTFVIAAERYDSKAPPAIVTMQSLRGPEAPARVDFRRPSVLVFDFAVRQPGGVYEAEVVDRVGRPLIRAAAVVKDGRLTASIRELAPGSYWVRVYSRQPARLLAEYSLQSE